MATKTTLVKTANGYDFWRIDGATYTAWNITPQGQGKPEGGYRSKSYIEQVKHQRFCH